MLVILPGTNYTDMFMVKHDVFQQNNPCCLVSNLVSDIDSTIMPGRLGNKE